MRALNLDIDLAINLYQVQHKTISEIAKISKCSRETITKRLKEVGIKVDSNKYPKNTLYRNLNWLTDQYVKEKRSTVDIGIECGVAAWTVNQWLRKFNIVIRNSNEKLYQDRRKHVTKYSLSREMLQSEYILKKKTLNQIAQDVGCSWDTVRKVVKRYGFPMVNSKMYSRSSDGTRTSTDFRGFQKKCLNKYGYKCMICKYDKFVNAHHIEPWAKNHNNSVENGIVLCPNHHSEADYGVIDINELKNYQSSYLNKRSDTKIVHKDIKTTTPPLLLESAKSWRDFYKSSLSKDTACKINGIYCLFVSLEMYLKAYIVLKDKTYQDTSKLIYLGHNFNKIFEVVQRVAPRDFANKVELKLCKFNLFNENISELRYFQKSRLSKFSPDLFKIKEFEEIFVYIKSEIDRGFREWKSENPVR